MSKEKQGKRFVQIFAEDCGFFGPESSLVVDTETGVTYLIIRNTFGSGITPLLNADGKPIGGILPRVLMISEAMYWQISAEVAFV